MSTPTDTLMERIITELCGMPEGQVAEVLDFIDSLKSQGMARPERGSAEALSYYAGVWQFETGELDRLLADVERMREMEG